MRQYDTVGELIRALQKTYVINTKTRDDVADMWVCLGQVRALLPVQMSQEEEELMRERLWSAELLRRQYNLRHTIVIRKSFQSIPIFLFAGNL